MSSPYQNQPHPGQNDPYGSAAQYGSAEGTPYAASLGQTPYGQASYTQPTSGASASDPYGQGYAPYGQAPYSQPTSGSSASEPYGLASAGYTPAPVQQQSLYGQAQPYSLPAAPAYGQSSVQEYAQPATTQYANYSAPPYSGQALQPYGYGFGIGNSTPRPKVTFGQAIKLAIKNATNFTGRASLSEYWWFTLFLALLMVGAMVLVGFGTAIVGGVTGSSDAAGGMFVLGYLLVGLISLAALLPSLSLGIRRLHDTNQSGWMMLLGMVPYVGGIINIILMAQPSRPEGARYDDPTNLPKGPEHL